MLTTKNIVEVKLRAYKKLAGSAFSSLDVIEINANRFQNIQTETTYLTTYQDLFDTEEYTSLGKDFKYYFPMGMFYYLFENVPPEDFKYITPFSNAIREYIRAFAKHRAQQLQQYLNVIEKCNLKKKSSKRS